MSAIRSFGSLLGRSRLLVVAGLALAVFAAVGFLDLAVTQAQMRAQYEAELQRVERLREQNALLQQELDRAQLDQHIPWLSWDYFGTLPKGTGVIEDGTAPEEAAVAQAGPQPEAPRPFWTDLLERLR